MIWWKEELAAVKNEKRPFQKQIKNYRIRSKFLREGVLRLKGKQLTDGMKGLTPTKSSRGCADKISSYRGKFIRKRSTYRMVFSELFQPVF